MSGNKQTKKSYLEASDVCRHTERMFCAQITRYDPKHFPATIHFWTNTRPTSNFLSQPSRRRRRGKKEKEKKNPATCKDAIGSMAVHHQPSHYFQRLLPAQRYSAFSVNQYTSGALIQRRKRLHRATAATGEQWGPPPLLNPTPHPPRLVRAAAFKS